MAENTMFAIYHNKFGGPEVTQAGEIRKPEIEDLRSGEVLVKVLAASLNPADYKQRQGGLRPLISYKMPVVFGFDFSGIVVGQKDTKFKVGDSVFGMVKGLRRGSLAQFLIVDGEICALKPTNVSDEEAASVPLVGITAVLAFRKCGMVEYDHPSPLKVLITGGAGGVGSCAIQLAKNLYHATFVATTASPGAKTDFVKKIGADRVANYREKDIVSQLDDCGPFHVIFDCVGDLTRVLPLIAENGSVVSIATAPTVQSVVEWLDASGESEHVVSFAQTFLRSDIGKSLVDRILGATSVRNKLSKKNVSYHSVIGTGSGEIMKILAQELETGKLKAAIDKNFPLTQGIDAIAYIESGRTTGKVTLTIHHEDA